MPSPIKSAKAGAEVFALALLAASSLQIMENLLPRIPLFPWMRIGFSYVILLPFLLRFGPRAAFALLLGRNVIAVLYGGQPLTTFLIGSGSGAIALLGLGQPVAWAHRRGWLGLLGASVILAAGFNLAQLALVNVTLIRHAGFYFQTGPILAWSLASGACVAFLIHLSGKELASLLDLGDTVAETAVAETAVAKTAASPEGMRAEGARVNAPAPVPPGPFLAGLALLLCLFLLPDLRFQLPFLAISLAASRHPFRTLMFSWPFFLYLAWLHLFHTSGAYLWGEWITREGAIRFAEYSARLANLILLGKWLAPRFPWQWAGRSRSPYLRGFLLSLPLMADLFKPSLELGREMIRNLFAGRRRGLLAPAFDAWRGKMREAARVAETEPG